MIFTKYRKIIIIALICLLGLFIALNLPRFVTVTTSLPDSTILLDGKTVTTNTQNLTFSNKHTIVVKKDAYYPSTQTVEVSPFENKKISVALTPKTKARDIQLSSTGEVPVILDYTLSFCDRFKNSFCINSKSSNEVDYSLALTQLTKRYPNDTSMMPVFHKDLITNDIYVSRMNDFTIKLTSNEYTEKPILVVVPKSSNQLTAEATTTAIKAAVKDTSYSYYILYVSPELNSASTLPQDNMIYWNEYGE